jgi:hypothetical protein
MEIARANISIAVGTDLTNISEKIVILQKREQPLSNQAIDYYLESSANFYAAPCCACIPWYRVNLEA